MAITLMLLGAAEMLRECCRDAVVVSLLLHGYHRRCTATRRLQMSAKPGQLMYLAGQLLPSSLVATNALPTTSLADKLSLCHEATGANAEFIVKELVGSWVNSAGKCPGERQFQGLRTRRWERRHINGASEITEKRSFVLYTHFYV